MSWPLRVWAPSFDEHWLATPDGLIKEKTCKFMHNSMCLTHPTDQPTLQQSCTFHLACPTTVEHSRLFFQQTSVLSFSPVATLLSKPSFYT